FLRILLRLPGVLPAVEYSLQSSIAGKGLIVLKVEELPSGSMHEAGRTLERNWIAMNKSKRDCASSPR
ncbi:Dbl domain-containing protein, partial [Moniliophthora roreri]